jgi:nitrogen fixation protein NifU and related proteins
MDLYAEHILDHFRAPHHAGSLENPTVRIVEHNPLCGDVIVLDIAAENDTLTDLRFSGTGCAISQAAMSLLADEVEGMSFEQLSQLTPDDVYALLGVQISPARVTCALLGFAALKRALNHICEQDHV